MLKLGEKQTLKIIKTMEFGVYLSEEPSARKEQQVLLPIRQVPENAGIGDEVEVFLYKDSNDRMIATVHDPLIMLHEVKLLKVRDITRVGAFLDWGLEKDLLLPYHEQRGKIHKGDEVLAALYIDKSGRMAATMNVYPYLKKNAPYEVGDEVTGRVYEVSRNFGVFIAVDDQYSAMIPKRDAQGKFEFGQVLSLRVTAVKSDGKLDVTAKKKAYQQIGPDAKMILEYIQENGGELEFDDKAAPELINDVFGLSKAAFKRAVGNLLKEKKVVKEDGKIFLAS
ncbi:MAG TPA: RNA-binding protein [Lachnospiraceae bacterium]|nr:RNA-binding protein [Lachnospiraceae bacterium]